MADDGIAARVKWMPRTLGSVRMPLPVRVECPKKISLKNIALMNREYLKFGIKG